MIAVGSFGLADGFSGFAQAELMRGAVAGAFFVAMAFLAGYAAIRRSGLAVCALLMVAGAAALEFSWLGFFSAMPAEGLVMMQALFAAGAIVFLSAAIGAARYNALLGGVMFTAALVLGGMGVINFFDRVDLAPLMRTALIGVGGFAVILSALQAFRGDSGARLILPGVALAAAAPVIAMIGGESSAMAFASHGLFTLGVLSASIVALTEGGATPLRGVAPADGFAFNDKQKADGHSRHKEYRASRERTEIVLDSQIARVLDYSGVGIWDWSEQSIDQTHSLASLLGADSDAPFTPDAFRNFIHEDDVSRFDNDVMSSEDGPFDVHLKLFDGRVIRMRGARAADNNTGEIERLVAFVENIGPKTGDSNGVNEVSLRSATEAAIVPSAPGAMAAKVATALENGDIIAAFQPIVALDNHKVAGFEALARWRDQEGGADEGPEQFVKAAERAGQGGALALTMLDQAALFLAEALEKEKRKDLFVAMNVSWGQIREDEFLNAVRDTVSKYDLPKKSLVLELTEADAVTDDAIAADVFKKLKDAGAALAFDDFGAGFTCLSNLRKYDFDYLKIDKSFTRDLESGGDGAKIVNSLASLGKAMGLKVIIEGVESKSAAQKAKQFGCAFGQGYQFGKPEALDRPVMDVNSNKPAEETISEKLKFAAAPEQTSSDLAAPDLAATEKTDVRLKAPVSSSESDAQLTESADDQTPAAEKSFEKKIEVDFSGGGEGGNAQERKNRGWRLWGRSNGLR
ncbi:EAL domain-containing protein [Hyphococcus sp.]|uniref:EAL domain-containing protein n=1 Tax=Hyphococcus sp. TaxID=2038636 RepID=UPI003CCC13D5